FFVQNVLVMGAPSTGKSSLVQDLARRYSTSYSTEYAKEYRASQHVAADELDVKDLHAVGIGQFENNKRNIHSPGTRKVFFADTDVMMTKIYMKMHAVGDEFHQLKSVFDYFIALQNWSLVLVLPPREGDGSEYSATMHQMILEELEQQELKDVTHILEGESYRDQYQEAHSRVDQIHKDVKENANKAHLMVKKHFRAHPAPYLDEKYLNVCHHSYHRFNGGRPHGPKNVAYTRADTHPATDLKP